ncbi:MAG TPA: hypothetical protein VMG37_19375 [Solirubrobacteraceae bacterium]|nr:hypothetical protein [Solirubrobacteraceae bacterium]
MATRQPADDSSDVVRPSRTDVDRRRQQRLIAAGVIGALVVVFALINLNDVKVHWLIATGQTPLIVVIVLAFLLGIAADRLLLARARRKRERAPES